MAIQTIKATMQMRRGAEANFDPDQMTAGEWAVSTDSKKVWMCFAPGIVRRMATYEAFESDMVEIQNILATCQDIQEAVEAFEQLAEEHKNQAEAYSKESKSWAVGGTGTRAGEDTNNSKYWSQQSANSATSASASASTATIKADAAGTSATNAANSATSAYNSATTATQKATDAGNSATAAATSATNAAASESTATTKANAASASATAAASSATSADTYAKQAQSYAVGTGGVRPNEATDNAKYYYEQSRDISQGLAGALMPMGTVTFANLPLLENVESGWMYNVSDEFVTDSTFKEGVGRVIPAGSNVYKTADGFWDILAGTPVTTVNGQTGNVTVNLGNIEGTLPISKGGTGANTATNGLNNLTAGASVESESYQFSDNDSVLWMYTSGTGGTFKTKLSKLWNYIKGKLATVATSGSYNDLSNKPTIPSVGNGTVTIKQAGASKGSFTMNQSGNTEINLTDNNTTYGVVSKTAAGLAPQLPNETTTTKYLRQDGTWQVPPDTNTTYGNMTAASASAAGKAGLAPAPPAGAQNSYLTGSATYQNVDDHAAAFTSADVDDGSATAWTSVAKLVSGETHKSIFNKASTMFKNVRYLYKMLGTTNISTIGGGTVTGAISALNTHITPVKIDISDVFPNRDYLGIENGECILIGEMLYLFFYFRSKNVPGNPTEFVNEAYRPATSYAVLPLYYGGSPYNPANGSCWIGESLVIYGGSLKAGTRYYACGMYIIRG